MSLIFCHTVIFCQPAPAGDVCTPWNTHVNRLDPQINFRNFVCSREVFIGKYCSVLQGMYSVPFLNTLLSFLREDVLLCVIFCSWLYSIYMYSNFSSKLEDFKLKYHFTRNMPLIYYIKNLVYNLFTEPGNGSIDRTVCVWRVILSICPYHTDAAWISHLRLWCYTGTNCSLPENNLGTFCKSLKIPKSLFYFLHHVFWRSENNVQSNFT